MISLKDIFVSEYLKSALYWVGCKETGNNTSNCVDTIKKLSGYDPDNDAWCVQFVYGVFNQICQKHNVTNPLFKTKSSYYLKTKSKVRVDNKASVGSVFYFTREGGGHVGFVMEVKDGKMVTIEGNRNDAVWTGERELNSKKFQFLHIEEVNVGFSLNLIKSTLTNKKYVPYYVGAGLLTGLAIYKIKK